MSKLRVYTVLEEWYAMDGFQWKEYLHVFTDRAAAAEWVKKFAEKQHKKGCDFLANSDDPNYWELVQDRAQGELRIKLFGERKEVEG